MRTETRPQSEKSRVEKCLRFPRRMKRKTDADAEAIQPRNANLETAYIYRLPNELLNLIFTFLFLLEDALCPIRPNPRTTVHVKPILVVRWVSVWFRKVASQHTFWLDDKLDIIHCLSNEDSSPQLHVFKLPSGYLGILLNDNDLRNCLQQRSKWTFYNTNDLIGVLNNDPSFFRNTPSLEFNRFHRYNYMPLRKLGLFVSLTSLLIRPLDPVNLDRIAAYCPLLKSLELEGLDKFKGSLAPLQNITYLNVFMSMGSEAPYSCPFSSIIPLHSANILTHLILLIPSYDSAISFESITSNPFDAFVTLTHVTISIFNPELYEFVADARTTSIVSLKLVLDLHKSDAEFASSILPEMLSANSLKNLRSLTLLAEDPSVYELIDNLLDSTTLAGFQYLQDLDLDFPVPTAWWSDLENLRSLEFLRVCVDLEKYGMGGFDRDEIAVAGKKLIASIFANRDRKLRVVVKQRVKVWEPSVTIFDDWF